MRLGGRGSQTSGLDTMGDLVEIMRIGGHHSLLIAACCEGGRGVRDGAEAVADCDQ